MRCMCISYYDHYSPQDFCYCVPRPMPATCLEYECDQYYARMLQTGLESIIKLSQSPSTTVSVMSFLNVKSSCLMMLSICVSLWAKWLMLVYYCHLLSAVEMARCLLVRRYLIIRLLRIVILASRPSIHFLFS